MLSYLHATYRWPFVSRSGTAMAHTASATTTQHLQGAAIPLPADTKKMRIKSLKFLAAKCSTHAVLAVVLYREVVFSSNPMWSRPNWSCDVRYHLPGLRSSLVWRVTGSLSLLPISLTVEPTLGPCRMELAT